MEERLGLKMSCRSSHCGATGLVASWEHWDAGSIPGSAEQEKDLAWPQLWCRSQLPLESDLIPGPGTPHAAGQLKRRRKMDSFQGQRGSTYAN